MYKIAIIGTGHVGESTALILAQNDSCKELILIDSEENRAQGVALDITQSAPLTHFDTRITGTNTFSALHDANLVIVTAGFPRKPGMSRPDLLECNKSIISEVCYHIENEAPECTVLIVTNPVDILTYIAWKITGGNRNRFIGLSGVLDSTRMASFVSMETGFSMCDVTALVLGGHGDALVALPRYTCVNGIPITEILDPNSIQRIIERTRSAGSEILNLKNNSSAYQAPARAIATMVDAIVHDRKRVLPCSVILQGEYGLNDLAIGVPCVLGRNGIEKIIQIQLSKEEMALIELSADSIKKDLI